MRRRDAAERARLADLWLLSVTVVWGGTFILIKEAVEVVPPLLFNGLRFVAAALAAYLLFRRSLSRQSLGRMLANVWIGLTFSAGFFLQAIGLRWTTAGRSAFITGSVVVLTPFVVWLFSRTKPAPLQWGSALVAFVGLALYARPEAGQASLGDVLTLVGAVGWAFYLVLLDRAIVRYGALSSRIRTAELTLVQLGSAAIFAVLLSAAFESWPAPQTLLSGNVLAAIAYTSMLASVFATVVQTRWQAETTPVRTAVIFSLEPIVAAALGVLVLGEPFGPYEVAGALLIVSAVLIPDLLVLARKR